MSRNDPTTAALEWDNRNTALIRPQPSGPMRNLRPGDTPAQERMHDMASDVVRAVRWRRSHDPEFRARLAQSPALVLRSYDLTDAEREALEHEAGTDPRLTGSDYPSGALALAGPAFTSPAHISLEPLGPAGPVKRPEAAAANGAVPSQIQRADTSGGSS